MCEDNLHFVFYLIKKVGFGKKQKKKRKVDWSTAPSSTSKANYKDEGEKKKNIRYRCAVKGGMQESNNI